jgi:hypothetical protein
LVKPSTKSFVSTAFTTCAIAIALPASGQESVTDEELQEQLRTRDAIIIELQRRLEELELRLDDAGVLEVVPEEPTIPAETPPRPDRGLEVDELAADRALERTLVEEGALLLPFGQAEINTSANYTRREGDFPIFANDEVLEARIERNEFEFDLGLAVGLPFDSQVEVGLPYNLVEQEETIRGGGASLNSQSEWGHGVGDLRLGLAKTVLREDGNWWPDVVVRGTWDTNTGERSDNGVPLDGSFNELIGSVSLLKRKDPLAFVATAFYSYTFEDDDIKPGEQFGLALGANVALSPEASLSVTLQQAYTDDVEFDGDKIDGSDQLASSFDFGGSVIVAPRTLLRVVSSIGLTDDAPDYGLRAALSYRFNTPFF